MSLAIRFFFLSFLFTAVFLVSCVPHKKYLYFREGKEYIDKKTYAVDSSLVYKIQTGDILNITISSTVASKQELLNQKFEEEGDGGPSNGTKANGYVVGSDGNIELPMVGKIQVLNLSIEEINDTVRSRLSEYLDFIYVKTSLVNFKITILGEVKLPGTKLVADEKITIFQALGMAGDITDFGNRKKVRILRKVNTEHQVIIVDVSKADIIGSKYYYLHPNDVIYVEPLVAKSIRFNLTLMSLATSLLTLTLIVITRLKL